MALDLANLVLDTNQLGSAQQTKIWLYTTTDNLVDVKNHDYFNNAALLMKEGSIIKIIANDGMLISVVDSVSWYSGTLFCGVTWIAEVSSFKFAT